MSKTIITYNEIIEINNLLREQSLNYKLHLHDACGSQSFTIEPLGNCEGQDEKMKDVIINYFSQKGIQVKFLENNLEFIIC
jgi:hypothetical protein